ncbi:MAG: hypothetical protein RIS76_2001, partial [Verrucomicrobiota bacterium]
MRNQSNWNQLHSDGSGFVVESFEAVFLAGGREA